MDRNLGVLDAHQDDHLEQVAAPIWADDGPAIGVLSGVSMASAWSIGVMDVRVGDTVLSRRVVDLHHAWCTTKKDPATSVFLRASTTSR